MTRMTATLFLESEQNGSGRKSFEQMRKGCTVPSWGLTWLKRFIDAIDQLLRGERSNVWKEGERVEEKRPLQYK